MFRKVILRTLIRNHLYSTKTIQYFSHLNNTDFDQPFKEQQRVSALDQLNSYQQYLIKHNLALRKPHEKLRTEEQRIFQKCLKQQKYSSIMNFLFKNSNRRLCSLSTAVNVDQALASQYQNLKDQQKKMAAFTLVNFREQKVFNLFKKEVEKQISQKDIESIDVQSFFIYLYGQIIKHKKLDFIANLLKNKQKNYKQSIQIVYKSLFFQKYKGIYQVQYNNLLTLLQLILNPSLNKLEQLNRESAKQRSHLQSLVQSFLKVLGHSNLRECTINNYKVDFLIENKKKGLIKNIALQVNGNYHYTLDGKLKGRQILRNLIINQCVPLRIVHQEEFLQSKGHRNKLAYLENLLTLKDVNWQSKNEGWDSGWQVSQAQKMASYPSK